MIKKKRFICLNNKVLLFTALGGLFLIALIYIHWQDNDILTMLVTGAEWREHGPVYQNVFTFVPDMDFVAEQWLWCVILSFVWDTFGSVGMMILNIVQGITFAMLMYLLLRIRKTGSMLSVILTIFISVNYPYKNLRPQLISCIFLVLQCLIIEYALKTKRRAPLFLLPIIMWLEVNIHAPLWVLHVLFLIPYFIHNKERKILKETQTFPGFRKTLVLMLACMICIMFVNPYGYKLPAYILVFPLTPSLSVFRISELKTSFGTLNTALFLLLIILTILYVIYETGHKRKCDMKALFMCAIIIIIASTSVKQTQYSGFGYIYLFSAWMSDLNVTGITGRTRKTAVTASLIITMLFISGTVKVLIEDAERIAYTEKTRNEILNVLETEGAKAGTNVFTSFNAGNIAEYGGYHCYIDSRPEIYGPFLSGGKDIIDEYKRYRTGDMTKDEFTELLDKYDCRYVVSDIRNPLYMKADGWKTIFDEAEVLEHNNHMNGMQWSPLYVLKRIRDSE